MATNISNESLSNLPDAPHHPKDFVFPKRSFGMSKLVLCSAQSQWFVSWPFIHYDEVLDVVYCYICITALKFILIKASKNFANAFMSTGFSNWKDATASFEKHQLSKFHAKAVEVVVKLPNSTKDVGEQLSRVHRADKVYAKDMLRSIISSVRYLSRQGLALRGDGSNKSSNLIQLLRLRSENNPQMLHWLNKSARKHTPPENQNEMLELMAHHVLRRILEDIHSSPFLAVMVDEATDKSNKEQLTIVIRWIDDDFIVSEEFLGLYYLSATNAESIVDAIMDIFLRFQIPLSMLRGQCYDGCSTMTGAKTGVAAKINEMEPRSLFTHCYGHALNLAVSDTIKRSRDMGDCLDTCFELVKLIKFSPKREAKTYLRNTMTQARLNHLMILHYHQEKCDKLDLECIANDYIKKNETRRSTFATY